MESPRISINPKIKRDILEAYLHGKDETDVLFVTNGERVWHVDRNTELEDLGVVYVGDCFEDCQVIDQYELLPRDSYAWTVAVSPEVWERWAAAAGGEDDEDSYVDILEWAYENDFECVKRGLSTFRELSLEDMEVYVLETVPLYSERYLIELELYEKDQMENLYHKTI